MSSAPMTTVWGCAPSYWARLSEMLLADNLLRFSRGTEPSARSRPQQPAGTGQSELPELMVAHLSHLPEPEAVGRVTLTVRFLNSGLARWERDSQVCAGGVTPLAPFALTLTDLAVAMLEASSSVPPQVDAHLRHPPLASHQALPVEPGRCPARRHRRLMPSDRLADVSIAVRRSALMVMVRRAGAVRVVLAMGLAASRPTPSCLSAISRCSPAATAAASRTPWMPSARFSVPLTA